MVLSHARPLNRSDDAKSSSEATQPHVNVSDYVIADSNDQLKCLRNITGEALVCMPRNGQLRSMRTINACRQRLMALISNIKFARQPCFHFYKVERKASASRLET